MTSHELARKILEFKDSPIHVSVDISTGDHDFGKRAFGEVDSIEGESEGYGLTILVVGKINEEWSWG